MRARAAINGAGLRCAWIVALAVGMAAGVRAEGKPSPYPWKDGETLEYGITWGVVRAAKGTFTAKEKPQRWEFRLHLVSQATVDTFYPINDWFWSFQSKSPWRSMEYGEDRSEGKRRIRERTRFNYPEKLAIREKWTKAEDDRIPLTGDAFDDIGSMLYALRMGSWKVGDKRPINVVESSDIKTGEAACEAIEKRKFDPWPECEVIRIHCVPTGETAKKKKGQLTVWITNDARRLPLHAALEFKYGTFDMALEAAMSPWP